MSITKAYYGSKISKNIMKTPEGFLICKNVAVARTGTQRYLRKEIGLEENPNDIVIVYRTDEEVFHPRTLASFEGKVFTDEHPNDWVTPLNCTAYMKGTTINVRRGEGQEKDLLLADIIIYNQDQIDEVESKQKREISCGYECSYEEHKNGYKQTNIIGNHIALVAAGRAGDRVAIRDNKFKEEQEENNERGKQRMADNGGYKLPRKNTNSVSDFLKSIGLKHLALDAQPEEIMEAMDELVNEKYQEERDAEPVIIEKEKDPTEDEDMDEVKREISEVKDAIYALLTRDEEEEEIETEDEDEDESLESLDSLEEELTEDDSTEETEEVEEDPEDMNKVEDEDEDEDEATGTKDSIKELLKVLKPLVANIPDAKQRKKTADALAATLKKHSAKAKTSDNSYAKMITRSKDSKIVNEAVDHGLEIAKKYNPHYKEV